MTWNQLTGAKTVAGSIANFMNNSQITSGTGGVADTLLQEAMNWIVGSGLKHWRSMPQPATGTMTIGQAYITLPVDFYEADIFYITGVNWQPMQMRTPQDVIASWSYDGNGVRINQQPTIYYVDQASMQFDSPPDQAYPYVLVYYAEILELSTINPSNFLTRYYPRLVRAACMAHASEWAKDAGAGNYDRNYWWQQAIMEQQACQADSDRSRRATVFAGVMEGGGPVDGFPMYGRD